MARATYGKGVSTVEVTGLNDAIRSLRNLKGIFAFKAAEVAANAGIELLRNAVGKAPVDTGDLRNSGLCMFSMENGPIEMIADGNPDGTITVDAGSINPRKVKDSSWLEVEVSFERYASRGKQAGKFDVAVWTHEDLNPYGGASPAARVEGTGPKYLEKSWYDVEGMFVKKMKSTIRGYDMDREIRKATVVTRKAATTKSRGVTIGTTTVDEKFVDFNKVARKGFALVKDSGGAIGTFRTGTAKKVRRKKSKRKK